MFRTTRILTLLLFFAVPIGFASSALAGPTGPECGNGEEELGEQCDDGNIIGGDGCSSTCQLEICGNEVIDPGEQCDDGNLSNGDGCSSDCLIEECGNGIEDPGEQCDDGNTVGGDGCAADCTIEGNDPFCGDGNEDPGEQCDDGNNENGDGCNSECMLEICGNGTVDEGEECDDGNDVDGDGCSNNCTIEIELPECGNGQVELGEECDDGNTDDGDGCSSECTIEEGDGQNPGQKLCINTMNKRLKDTSKAQSKVALDCFDESDPDLCLVSDVDGKMAKERNKTQVAKEKKCDPDNLPDFGFVGSTATHAAGVGASLAHVDDLFGSLDEALSEETLKCQEKVTKESQEVLDKLFRLAGKGKRRALDAGASSALELQTAIVALINSDDGKFDRFAHYKIGKAVSKGCETVDLDKAFPGCAPKVPAAALARGLEVDPMPKEGVTKCAVDSDRCRWCQAYNLADGLTIECDVFDDGSRNESCGVADPDPETPCDTGLCAGDETLSGQCSVFLAGCLDDELGGEECVGAALLICEGGPPDDVDEGNVCSRELCEISDDLAEHCEDFLGLCLAANPGLNQEECVGGALFICRGENL